MCMLALALRDLDHEVGYARGSSLLPLWWLEADPTSGKACGLRSAHTSRGEGGDGDPQAKTAALSVTPAAPANRRPRLEGQPSSTRRNRPRPRSPPGARSPSSGWRVGRGRWIRAPPDLPCAWRARPVSPQAGLRSGDARSRSSDRESARSRARPRSTPTPAQELAPLPSIYREGGVATAERDHRPPRSDYLSATPAARRLRGLAPCQSRPRIAGLFRRASRTPGRN